MAVMGREIGCGQNENCLIHRRAYNVSSSSYLRRGSNVNLDIVSLISRSSIGLQVDEQDEQQGARLHSTITATQEEDNVGIFSVELPCCQHHWQHHEHLIESHLQILIVGGATEVLILQTSRRFFSSGMCGGAAGHWICLALIAPALLHFSDTARTKRRTKDTDGRHSGPCPLKWTMPNEPTRTHQKQNPKAPNRL